MSYTFNFKDQQFHVAFEGDENATSISIDGEQAPLDFEKIDNNLYSIIVDGTSYTLGVLRKGKKVTVFIEGDIYELETITERDRLKSTTSGSGKNEIVSPMPSRVVKLLKSVGDPISVDEGAIVVEAMKMESELKGSLEGVIKEIRVSEGEAVEAGTVLIVISPE